MNEVECPELVEGQVAMYILRCTDKTYYVGSTIDISERLIRHHEGTASTWTAKRSPAILVYYEIYDNQLSARRREKQLKGWSREKKEKLITGIWSMPKN